MAYIITEKIKNSFQELLANEKVQKGLSFIEADQEEIIQKQMELTLIPAPTFQEEQKAKRMAEIFAEEGLSDVHIDEFGNAVGILKGSGGGRTTLVEGHMDTVFPMDTELNLRRENGWIYCPGICDDTRGCASVISVIRAIKAAGIVPKGDIQFVGTVQEEGMGGLGGMRYYVQHHPELEASISIDGDGFQAITYQATGIQTYEVTFQGIGGHAQGAFAKVANPIHAAGRAIAKISEFRIPEGSETTFAVTNLEAGNISAVHAIVNSCTIRFNFRANVQAELEDMRNRIFAAIEEACKEETDRWGMDTITYTVKHLCDVNVGFQADDVPIVQAAYITAQYLGCEEPTLSHGGATNCSRALEAGLPAICLGGGSGHDSRCHTLEEQFCEEGAYKGCQSAFLIALLCAGIEGCDSII